MKFKIGDKVAVIDAVFKGKVNKIVEDVVFVETDEGFLFEYAEKELVLITENQSELSKYSDIANDDLLQKISEKNSRKTTPKFKSDKKEKQPPMEVDLHIHHLVPSTAGMDNFDILTVQLNTAKAKLDFAVKNRIQKVVFIHGVGEGVLKSELEFLFKKYHVDYYAASFQKYGLGATEVYIYQNPPN
jgi:dsDNA-specific endonuclease/ATPase MutS2